MAKRKRTSRQSGRQAGFVDRAVRAGRRALKEAESRVPPDLRRQVERRLKDADKTARAAIKTLQTQVQRASTRTDVNNVLKRIDGLTRQARQIALGSRSTTSRRAATTTRRTSSTKTRKTTPATRRKPAKRAAAPQRGASNGRGASTARTARPRAPRRRRAEQEPIIAPVSEVGAVEIIEVVEP